MDDEARIEDTGRNEADQDIEQPDRSGAYAYDELLDENRQHPAEEFSNPSGIGRGECESDAAQDETCDIEATAQVGDMVLEETKPGFGIDGFEGEEVGGG